MTNLWTLGGLSLRELLYRTARESWQDAVFGQASRMAFYHFLAMFPCLLLFLAICARVPHLGGHMKHAIGDLSSQVLPDQASQLVGKTIEELDQRTVAARQVLSACAGALWAALNGTWALIYGLNTAYELEERRPWWKLAATIAGLTLSLAVTGTVAVLLIFGGTRLQSHPGPAAFALRAFQWIVLTVLLSISFALLYRYAPNLRDHKWRWSTPGALLALFIWIGSTLAVRIYFNHVNDYARSYGHLNGVVMLLLWLYATNGSILIGGEMNSEIEKAAAASRGAPPDGAHGRDRSGA